MEAAVIFKASFVRCTIGYSKPLVLMLSLAFGVPALANGFVKRPNEVYGKVSFSADKKMTETSGAGDYVKTTQQVQGYGELGLPLPWRSQISLSTSVRQVTRKSVDKGDSFESRGFSDTQLNFKSLVHEGELARPLGVPVAFLFAAEYGLNLPTTREKYRTGNESVLAAGVSPERVFLVSPIDRGVLQTRQGLGVSLFSSGVWLSMSHMTSVDRELSAPGQTARVELGTSLPQSSWLQLSFQNSSSNDNTNSASAQKTPHSEKSFGFSGGYTFLPGWAAETGITFVNSVDFHQWSVGISYRTM
jgi:hypothetical protein